MAWRAAGMAVLSLLCIAARTQATLTLYQSRADTTPPGSFNRFSIEGVASVQVGGSGSLGYTFECFSSATTDGSLIVWTRAVGQFTPDTTTEVGGAASTLSFNSPSNSHLGVYICTDTTTDEYVELNITGANPAVCPVNDLVTVQEGLSTELDVYIAGFPVPMSDAIHWFRPNGQEIMDGDPNTQFLASKKRLVLSNVQYADAGSYEVQVLIDLGIGQPLEGRTIIDLNVQVLPRLLVQPVAAVTVRERESFNLSCTASGNPEPEITWARDDGVPLNPLALMLPLVRTTDLFLTNVTSTITIPSALYSDNGVYRCSVRNSLSPGPVVSDPAQVTVTPFLFVEAETAPGVAIPFTNVLSQPEASQFTVFCVGSGVLTWSSSTGATIPTLTAPGPTGSVYQRFDGLASRLGLFFTNFSLPEVAEYTCQTSLLNANNMVISEMLLITTSDPAVFITPVVLFVLEGGTVSIEAGVFASATPTVQWYHQGQLIDVDSDPQVSLETGANVYTLTVSGVDDQRLGEYSIVASLNGQMSSDNVTVSYPSPPMISVSQSELTVSEGGTVRVECFGSGVGMVTTRWLYSDGEALPNGVIQNGTALQIDYVTSAHAGTYQCVVTNLADSVSRPVQIEVLYPPFSVIRYEQVESTSTQVLSLSLNHGGQSPMFTCSSGGNPAPSIEWRRGGGGEFPTGIVADGQELVWRRAPEWSDSLVVYECVTDNGIGDPSVATLDLTVRSAPIINSIFPFQGIVVSGDSVLVPDGHTGPVLTCSAFGWPLPTVQWLYQLSPLPEGVTNTTISMLASGSSSSDLRFTSGFDSGLTGEYQCMVTSSVGNKMQTRVLNVSGGEATPQPPARCSVGSNSVNFQIRVLETDCSTWPRSLFESIQSTFEDDLSSIIGMQCNCSVDDALQVEQSSCSSTLANGVIFRGTITTSTVAETEKIFCILSTWQENNPSVNIGSTLFQVDSTCSLELDSFNSAECMAETGLDQTTLILVIAVPTGAVLIILALIFLLCCVRCWCKSCKSGEWTANTGPYSRTDIRYGQHAVAPTPDYCSGENTVYATLNRPFGPPSGSNNIYTPHDDSPQHLPLVQTGSLSRDRLIKSEHESLDGEFRYLHTESSIDHPSMSTGNVQNVGFSHFPYGSNPSSGSSSRVTSPPQRGPSGSVVSAVNPIPDYEQLDYTNYGVNPGFPPQRNAMLTNSLPGNGFSVERSSPTILSAVVEFPPNEHSAGPQERFSTASLRNRSFMEPVRSSPGTASSISKPSRWSETTSEDRRDSNCSEGLPPYSSRPASQGLTPATSMLDNSAYGHIQETTTITEGSTTTTTDPQWFMNNSDFSIDSKSSRHEPRAPSHRPSDPIPPYAMIQNSAIPYTPTSIVRQGDVSRSSPGTPRTPVFRLNQRDSATPQPYSEPVRTGITSPPGELTGPKDTAPSIEMVTVTV